MPDDTKSKIAELEKTLYSQDFKTVRGGDVVRHTPSADVPSEWSAAEEAHRDAVEEARALRRTTMLKKFAIFSLAFFAVSALVAGVIWWRGANLVSGENIKIEASLPPAVAGGEAFETKLTFTNNNKVPLESVRLFVEYPAGFYRVDERVPLVRMSKDLGTIAVGQSVAESIHAIAYGEENTQKDISLVLEYRIAGSNATLTKKSLVSTRLLSSPVKITLDTAHELSSGQPIEFTITVESNSANRMDSLLVDVEYPFGFTYRGATPAPAFGNSVWNIGALAPHEKRNIVVRGVAEGREGEQKLMKVSVGIPDQKDERLIGVTYNRVIESLAITKPFLGLNITINNSSDPAYASPAGRVVRADILWQSNLPERVTDAVLEVKLSGNVLNRYSIYATNGGFYRSVDDTIVWQKEKTPELAVVEPGTHGGVSFSFSPVAQGLDTAKIVKNPSITFEVTARGRSGAEGGVTQDIMTFANRTVRFNTELRLTAQALYFSGPLKNTGPLPPKADTPTTYTIKWSVRNSSNSVSDTVVKAKLPTMYVTWLGTISPSGESVSYNEATGEVQWNVGRISSGGAREVAFQVSLLPSLSQLNTTPQLLGDSVATAVDDFTKAAVEDRKPGLTTYLTTDPGFSQNQANVVQ